MAAGTKDWVDKEHDKDMSYQVSLAYGLKGKEANLMYTCSLSLPLTRKSTTNTKNKDSSPTCFQEQGWRITYTRNSPAGAGCPLPILKELFDDGFGAVRSVASAHQH